MLAIVMVGMLSVYAGFRLTLENSSFTKDTASYISTILFIKDEFDLFSTTQRIEMSIEKIGSNTF